MIGQTTGYGSRFRARVVVGRRNVKRSMGGFHKALSCAVASKAQMYGFPLIIWTSGGLQAHRLGVSSPWDVVAFAGGALTSVTVTAWISCKGLTRPLPERDSAVRAFGAVPMISVPGSVFAGWAVASMVHGCAAFFLAALVTLLIFEVLRALELHMSAIRSRKPGADDG